MSARTAVKYGKQILRENKKLQLVRLGSMRISEACQRELRPTWVDELVASFDLDKFGTPEVSHRGPYYYVMDGQHRIDALKKALFDDKGWEEQHIECWVSEGLSEEDEAETFLALNHRKTIDTFQKFKVAVRANRPAENEIVKIVQAEGLTVSQQGVAGAVGAVGALVKVYKRNGGESLQRALRLARDSYGDPGLCSIVIDGFGLLCHRYNGVLDEKSTAAALSRIHGGVSGLLGSAEQLRQKTGSSKAQCVAAAAVTVINRDRDNKKKLQAWFKN